MKTELSQQNLRENLSMLSPSILPFVLPSHLDFMHFKLVEVVQPLHLVKLTKTQLTFNLGEELIIIIIIRVF
jgi:hypothetical protein